ncbi:MAG: lamin tail domain-containing protein [Candidatus Marinimicrobia bacterium]|nr:lamin tail domain-containing protein [Candidatus Neomarinimicrobiota bacterium]
MQASSLRISEVMSNPQGSEYENEFIEVYNPSDHVMHINGWILSDGNGVDTIIHWSGPETIRSNGYALILDPSYDLSSGLYSVMIPDSIPVYTISTDASFGSGGLANSGESVHVYNPDTTVISQMTWTTASDNGYSWERVSIEAPDSLTAWEQSHVENGTPGFHNSVTPPLWNLSLNEVLVTHAVVSEPIEIRLVIKNTGEYSISAFSVFVVHDENQNDEYDLNEWSLFQEYFDPLESLDIIEIPLQLFELESGIQKLAVHIFATGDETTDDNTLHFEIAGAYPAAAVSITEIMSSPTTAQGGEWVELKNISTTPVSLQGWTLSDANQTRHLVTEELYFLQPESLVTLCKHTDIMEFFSLTPDQILVLNSWPTLNSAADSVRLFDASGYPVARAYYRGSWGYPGISLERRHPMVFPLSEWNWQPSNNPDGGTPSRLNTQQLEPVAIQIEAVDVVQSNPIGPAALTLIVHFKNMGLDTLHSLQLASTGSWGWQGALPSFQLDSLNVMTDVLPAGISHVPIRIYHDAFQLADTSIQVVLGFPPNQIALNEIHYLPVEDQVEFIEFVNIGMDTLNINGWSYGDRSGTRGTVLSPMLIPPDSLFLLCGDMATLSDWTPFGARIFELAPWPSLNNSSDSILVFDLQGNRQLTHGYLADQGGDPGRSLERLALWKAAESNASWATCQDPRGITPGYRNSVQVPLANLVLGKIQILDSLQSVNEAFSVQLQIINAGFDPADIASVNLRLFQDTEELAEYHEVLPILAGGDTLFWQIELELDQCGWIEMVAEVQSYNDNLPADNILTLKSYISCLATPLIINELMPVPLFEQPEWIELYNRSNRNVDLQDWLISDNSLAGKVITDSSLVLAPGAYLLLTGSVELASNMEEDQVQFVSGFPTLNNSEDGLVLYDPQGIHMDAMSYNTYTAMAEGRSLERIRSAARGDDPRNWGICIDEAASTAGRENSLNLEILPPQLTIKLNPNPFTPNGDGQADELVIQYELPMEQGLMSVMIFDMAGRKIAEPVQARAVSHRGQLCWDGEAGYGGKAVTGLYIMKMLVDDLAGNVYEILEKVYLVR